MSYNPNQPRDPAGTPTGGQWAGGSSAELSDDDGVTADILSQIEAVDGEFEEYGIRIDDIDEGDALKPESYLPDSRVWVDGDPTSDTLDGTSVIAMKPTEASIASAVRGSRDYFGHVVYVVGADYGSWGEDAGERVLRNAKVVAVYARDGSMGRITRRLHP